MSEIAQRICLDAAKLPPEQVADFVDRQCGDDSLLKQEVLRRLSALHVSDSFELDDRPTADSDGVEMLTTRPGSSNSAHQVIGPYKLLQKIGEGGMGTVWMAEQEHPVRRRVALKLIRADRDSRDVVARFEAERQALAMMDHPNIARVLDAGTSEQGTPYFVMELVKGIPLNQFCDQQRLDIRDRLELFLPICKAVQHAHQKGIIHRDLKPSNVLVANPDGQPLPKVIDFGLAKALEHTHKLTDKTLFTEFGKVVGTLQYMSPEQAELNPSDVDSRTDIYSLGVMLYELLTGTTPIEKDSLHRNPVLKVLELIKEVDPPLPSTRLSSSGDSVSSISELRQIAPAKLQQILKGDLDWVVMKAIEKERTRRYETANGLARDIQRFLGGEPVEAVPPSLNYRLKKFIGRNRTAVFVVATVLASLIVGITGTSIGLWEALRQAERAKQETGQKIVALNGQQRALDEAKQQRQLAQSNAKSLAIQKQKQAELLYTSDLNMIQAAWESGIPRRARNLLNRHIPSENNVDLRTFEWYYLDALSRTSERTPTFNYGDKAVSAAPDPVSSRIAIAGDDRSIQIWSLYGEPKLLLKLEGHAQSVQRVEFSRSGKYLLSCDRGEAFVWERDGNDFKLLQRLATHRPFEVHFSPDESRLAVPLENSITILEFTTRTQQAFSSHFQPITELTFQSDSQALYSASSDGTILKWDLSTGMHQLVAEFGQPVDAIELSDDDHHLAIAFGNQLAIQNLQPDEKSADVETRFVSKLPRSAKAIESLNNQNSFVVQLENEISVWQFDSGEFVGRLNDPSLFRNGIKVSSEGDYFASSGTDSLVHIWSTSSLERIATLRGHTNTVYGMAFLPTGGLVTASRDGTAKIWESFRSQHSLMVDAGTTRLWSLSFSADSQWLAVACEDARVLVWNVEDGTLVKELGEHSRSVQFVRFSADGRWLVSAGHDRSICLWDAKRLELLRRLDGHDATVNSLDFSPDSSKLVSGANGGSVIVWDLESGEQLSRFDSPSPADIWAVAFANTGDSVFFGGRDRMIRQWKFASSESAELIEQVSDNVTSLSVCQQGSLASATVADGSIFLFALDSSESRIPLIGHSGDAMFATFSPDGQTLLSSGSDGGRIQCWNVRTREPTIWLEGDRLHNHCVAFAPNGRRIAAARWDGTARIWKVE